MADGSANDSGAEILQRLDTMIAILRLAHAEEIDRTKEKLLSDKTNAALLKATGGSTFVASGDLKRKVMKETGESEKTVQRRILGLVELGALEVRPTGLAAYRASGLI
jgi:hypothetical protein